MELYLGECEALFFTPFIPTHVIRNRKLFPGRSAHAVNLRERQFRFEAKGGERIEQHVKWNYGARVVNLKSN